MATCMYMVSLEYLIFLLQLGFLLVFFGTTLFYLVGIE